MRPCLIEFRSDGQLTGGYGYCPVVTRTVQVAGRSLVAGGRPWQSVAIVVCYRVAPFASNGVISSNLHRRLAEPTKLPTDQ